MIDSKTRFLVHFALLLLQEETEDKLIFAWFVQQAPTKNYLKVRRNRGARGRWYPAPHCVLKWGFYANISWESRCNIEIYVWAHFYKILLVFEVPYQPWVKGMSGKSYNYQKLVKDASNLASFYGSHIDGIVCVKQIDSLGVGKDIK